MQERDSERVAPSADHPSDDAAREASSDILAGLVFACIGLAALVIGYSYPAGSALNMGPGYLPRIVAGALALVGVIAIARGLRRRRWRLPDFPIWSMVWIGVAILLFAVLIERAGLFLACLVCVVIAAAADPLVRWREVPVVAVLFSGFCALLFGYVLKLSVPVWPL